MNQIGWMQEPEAAYLQAYRGLVVLGASPADAADALQDAFERALKSPDRIRRPASWLFVVGLRRWKSQRWRARLFVRFDSLRSHPVAPPPGEDAVVLINELKRLPPREREVVVSRYVLGLTQRETAEALGMAVGTVAATTTHATRKLRERLYDSDERSGSKTPAVR
jgi:RNA polymerase sigma-70 factor, ECF subfamily